MITVSRYYELVSRFLQLASWHYVSGFSVIVFGLCLACKAKGHSSHTKNQPLPNQLRIKKTSKSAKYRLPLRCKKDCTVDFSGSNTDDSLTMAVSNSFLSPLDKVS